MSFLRAEKRAAPVWVPALAVMALGLAACGGSADDDEADVGQSVASTPLPDDLDPAIRTAAEEAASLNMMFITSHDELVRLAEESGPFAGFVSSDVAADIATSFTAATGIESQLEDFSGTDAYQRFLLEADSGELEDIDIQQAPPEHYDDFRALMAPYDIYGMAEAGILDIPLEMIDPENRNVVAVGSQIAGYAYNPNLLDKADIPTTWEGFCDTEFLDGRQFMLDVRPSNMAPLVAELGMEKVEEIATCLKDADPILTRGTTDALTRVTAGEVPLHVFTNYHSVVRAMGDAAGNLEVGLIDPIPVRLSNALGVMQEGIANNPYAALLFIEFMASPEGQALLDEDPLKSSVYSETSEVGKLVEGHETSGAGFENYVQMEDWMNTIVTDLGFPAS